MKSFSRCTRLTAIAAMFVMLAFFAGTSRTNAQSCTGGTTLTLGNNTTCKVTFCIRANPPLPISSLCITLGPSGDTTLPIPAGTVIQGMISAGGITYPFVFPSPPPIAGLWWVPNITTRPEGCCVDFYFDPSTCTMKALPSSAPPPCNP